MVEIDVLASSSAANAATVSDGTATVLLECGLPFSELRRRTGFAVSGMAGCLLSHEHGDHARAAADVMKAGVTLYASAGTLEALGVSGHRAVAVRPREPFEVGTWRVMGFDVPHDAAEPFGWLLESGDERVLYLCDCGYSPYRFAGLTRILIECNYDRDSLDAAVEAGRTHPAQKIRVLKSHLGLDRVLALLEANDLSRVREIHLLHLSDDHGDEVGFREAVQGATGKPVYVAPR